VRRSARLAVEWAALLVDRQTQYIVEDSRMCSILAWQIYSCSIDVHTRIGNMASRSHIIEHCECCELLQTPPAP
jgi:hypothetical protein